MFEISFIILKLNISYLPGSRELLPVYQDVILPLADVAIPNQFEAELITGNDIL